MIAIAQTPSTMQSTRQIKTPGQYEHFRKILKTRQKFPSSSELKYRQNEMEQTPATKKRPNLQRTQTANIVQTLETMEDKQIQPRRNRQAHYYSLYNLPYKNYKYLKPPGKLDVAQYLEGTLKLGQTLGIWDRRQLEDKLNLDNLRTKESTYNSEHLIKSRKPQGPSSCLETIYIARLQLDENNNDAEQQQRIKLMEQNLQSNLTSDQVKHQSQAYILNRWTRSAMNQRQCSRSEILPKFSFRRQQIDHTITFVRKSMESIITSQQSTITELPQPQTFFKFDPRQNPNKQTYQLKGQTVGTLKDNFQLFSKPIVGDRLLLSLQLNPDKLDQRVPFKTFQNFLLIYINKKANLKQAIDAILEFFIPDPDDVLLSSEFLNIIRVITDQFVAKHPNTALIYNELCENFRIANVIDQDPNSPIDTQQFKSVFISNQMHIYDLINLIAD